MAILNGCLAAVGAVVLWSRLAEARPKPTRECGSVDQWVDIEPGSDCPRHYWTCRHGSLDRRKCGQGQAFDPRTATCVDELACQKPDKECYKGVNYVVASKSDCRRRYYRCVDGDWASKVCRGGSEFDPRAEKCVKGFSSKCEQGTRVSKECAKAVRDPKKRRATKESVFEIGDSKRCWDTFTLCSPGGSKRVRCSAGYELDTSLGKCVQGHTSACRKRRRNRGDQAETTDNWTSLQEEPPAKGGKDKPRRQGNKEGRRPQSTPQTKNLKGKSCDWADGPCFWTWFDTVDMAKLDNEEGRQPQNQLPIVLNSGTFGSVCTKPECIWLLIPWRVLASTNVNASLLEDNEEGRQPTNPGETGGSENKEVESPSDDSEASDEEEDGQGDENRGQTGGSEGPEVESPSDDSEASDEEEEGPGDPSSVGNTDYFSYDYPIQYVQEVSTK